MNGILCYISSRAISSPMLQYFITRVVFKQINNISLLKAINSIRLATHILSLSFVLRNAGDNTLSIVHHRTIND